MRYLNCKVCLHSSQYEAPKEGLLYCHVNCTGCHSEFLCCVKCDLQVDMQNKSFVRFGRTPASYMRQHFRVTHSHALNDDEIPTQDRKKNKRQRIDDIVPTETYKTDDRVDAHDDHDSCVEHDPFVEADFECGLDSEEMGKFIRDDSDDSQSTEEACIDDENLFNPLMIQTAMTDASTTWEEIDRQTYECYIDYITCDLDPNSRPMEDYLQLDQINEDVHDIDDMLSTSLIEGDYPYYSYVDFAFFDTREENEKLIRRNSVRKSYCQNQLYFYQKYICKAKDNCDGTGGYRGLVGRANIGNRENANAYVSEKEARVAFKYHHIILKLPGEYKQDFVTYDNEKFELFGLDSTNHQNVTIKFPREMKDVQRFLTKGAHSIMKNFPVPKVFNLNNHACVGLEETIRIMAGHHGLFGLAWDGRTQKPNKDGLNGTQAVADLVNDIVDAMKSDGLSEESIRETHIGWVYFWSDSFLRCFVKQKDNSVWILTVTICPPLNEMSSGKYTHVLAMGKSSEDHTSVIEYYYREVKKLMKGFPTYFGDTNEIRRMSVGCLFHSSDRPERQSITNTRKEGHFGKCSNYAYCVDYDRLPACDECYKETIITVTSRRRRLEYRQCNKCFKWNIDPNNPLQISCPVSENYPLGPDEIIVEGETLKPPDSRKPGMKFIGPVLLTGSFMTAACLFAYEARRCNYWSKANMEEYLRSCNVRHSWIEHIEISVKNDKVEQRRSGIDEIVPQLWLPEYDCFRRHRFPMAPMHAIAHNMTAHVMDFHHQILSKWKKFNEFVGFANEIISDIETFKLDWCKVKTLPKAAWIGENKMGFVRLSSFLYGMFFLNANINAECRIHVSNMKRMVNAYHALVSLLMSKKSSHECNAGDNMRLFMSTAHYAHQHFGTFTDSLNDANKTNKQPNQINRKANDLVQNISRQDVLELLDKLDIQPSHGMQSNRIKLGKIPINDLKQRLREMGAEINGKKSDLQERLFTILLGRDIELTTTTFENQNTASDKAIKNDDLIWNKGAWLSFLASIEEQQKYLGPLTYIW